MFRFEPTSSRFHSRVIGAMFFSAVLAGGMIGLWLGAAIGTGWARVGGTVLGAIGLPYLSHRWLARSEQKYQKQLDDLARTARAEREAAKQKAIPQAKANGDFDRFKG